MSYSDVLNAWYSKDWYENMVAVMDNKKLVFNERICDEVMADVREKGLIVSDKEFVDRYEDLLGSKEYDKQNRVSPQ